MSADQSQVKHIETHDEDSRRERSFKAAAHNPSNTEEGRMHAAEEFAKLHEKRTGEKIDPAKEAEIGAQRAAERGGQS